MAVTSGLNNDVRGWILCFISGAGMLACHPASRRDAAPATLLILYRSLCFWSQRRVRRYSHSHAAGQVQFSHSRKQCISRLLPQPEFWRHGKLRRMASSESPKLLVAHVSWFRCSQHSTACCQSRKSTSKASTGMITQQASSSWSVSLAASLVSRLSRDFYTNTCPRMSSIATTLIKMHRPSMMTRMVTSITAIATPTTATHITLGLLLCQRVDARACRHHTLKPINTRMHKMATSLTAPKRRHRF